jgi:SAM-dependent methyltransferase
VNTNLIEYYKDRAQEYEKVYTKPERQHDLLKAELVLQDVFKGKDVFEIACGTGYWTERIAKTAHQVQATDINDTVLNIARLKTYSPAEVNFRKEDIFQLSAGRHCQSLFGGFIWSHIKMQDLEHFLKIIHDQVIKGATVVMMDNNYVAGSNLPITEWDDKGNSYQTRKLDNGSSYKVVKNFPDRELIDKVLEGRAEKIELISLEYYWILKYVSV